MGWYDWFALVYDPALEALYKPHRRTAAQTLDLHPGCTVLDVPCGTGQSFGALQARIGPEGCYVGVDVSEGMLLRARHRTRKQPRAYVLQHDART